MTTAKATAPAPALTDEIDLAKVLRSGAIVGVIMIFVGAIGMMHVFDARRVIDPIFSLGWAAVMWAPIVYGFNVSKRPVLEGMEAPRVGAHNVVAGAGVGLVGGAFLGGFLLAADAFNLREILINVTPALVNLLSLGQGVPVGALILTVGGAALGALGGAFHVMPVRYRSALTTGVLWVFLAGFLELVFGNILREAGLRVVDRLIYAPSRGLTVVAAVTVFLVAAGLKLRFSGRLRRVSGRYKALPERKRLRWMFVTAMAALTLGVLLPEVFGTFLNDVLSNVGLFMLLAFGLNVVVGYAGLLDLGYVAFFAVGAYTTAVVTSSASPTISPELAFFEALPVVLLMAAIAGLVIGTPVIRMRGDYLAIVTLGFGEIARIILLSDWLSGIFGGAQGLARISPLGLGPGSGIRVSYGYVLAAAGLLLAVVGLLRWRDAARESRGEVQALAEAVWTERTAVAAIVLGAVAVGVGVAFPTFWTWTITGIHPGAMVRVALVFVAFAAFIAWRLQESRVGRAWMAVREDEQIAQTMGINIVTTKLLAFVMGAMLASFGGSLFAVKLGTVFPHSFEIVQSIIILVIVIVGGMGSLRGVAIGAIVLIGILGGPTQSGLLREFGEFKLLLYGIILVWMMLQRPEGLWPSARRSRELHQEELLQDAWLKAQADAEAAEGRA